MGPGVFSAMTLLILAAVLYGFARTSFLAGMVSAPLPNRLIHVHGAAFTRWIVLWMAQTALLSARQVKLHRTLGLAGFGRAAVMVVLGMGCGGRVAAGFRTAGAGCEDVLRRSDVRPGAVRPADLLCLSGEVEGGGA
jgi:hypothetical protein